MRRSRLSKPDREESKEALAGMARDAWEHEVADCLARHPRVVLAILFGSFSKGRSRASSDVDVAIHRTPPYSTNDVSEI